jgi:hypothetical protein
MGKSSRLAISAAGVDAAVDDGFPPPLFPLRLGLEVPVVLVAGFFRCGCFLAAGVLFGAADADADADAAEAVVDDNALARDRVRMGDLSEDMLIYADDKGVATDEVIAVVIVCCIVKASLMAKPLNKFR